jgi:hypothetical protein
MRRLLSVSAVVCALAGAPLPPVAADDVQLESGNVIEGKVTRHDDKVVIELESGQITLSADSVKHIDRRESNVEHFERQYQALKPNDVAGRMALADYCRDHDMRARERTLLEEVIAREPNHAAARARLGYVRSDGGWITREQSMRERGMVQRDGQWMSREQAAELDRTQAEAAREKELAETELATRKLELQRQQLEIEQARAREERAASEAQAPAYFYGGYGYGYGAGYGYGRGHIGGHHAGRAAPSFPINGVRNPRDNSWSMPGVRNPRDVH